MQTKPALYIAAVVLALAASTPTGAAAPPTSLPVSVASTSRVKPETVADSLRALDRLRQLGYRWTTDAGALKVIKAWQRANGLTVDGLVGAETLASLDLPATATLPAVRVSPPAPHGTVAVPVDYSDPESIIRDVWPDELEDHAVAIATRESRLVPTARNACCWGLFQIHWTAHRSWLAALGITDPHQLLDARTNATAAYALYQRADAANGDNGDGWGPWAL